MKRVIEVEGVSGTGRILRKQDISDDLIVEDGRVIYRDDEREYPIFPNTSRWFIAPLDAIEGGSYDPSTGEASPPPDPREQWTLGEYKQRQQPVVRADAIEAFNNKWTAFDIYAAARQATSDRASIDADAQTIKAEYQRVRQAVIDATTYDGVDAAVASADFTV